MDVIALVGPSGTGKSHRALMVARQNHADAIIDDGILIRDNKILAGHSAKKEPSKIMAIRRAVFVLPGHATEVKNAIAESKPNRILILGTSDNMVYKIDKALDLPPISRIIRIEDIATKAEIAKAQFFRNKEGKHIIPVPTIELKPHFSGYLIDPIHTFLKRHSGNHKPRTAEKSIVRPVFSYYGRLIIDDQVLVEIVKAISKLSTYSCKPSHIRIDHMMINNEDKGIRISFNIILEYGINIPEFIHAIQAKVKTMVEMMTGMYVHEVDVVVKGFNFAKKESSKLKSKDAQTK